MKNLELSIETIQLQLSAIKINTDCGQYAIEVNFTIKKIIKRIAISILSKRNRTLGERDMITNWITVLCCNKCGKEIFVKAAPTNCPHCNEIFLHGWDTLPRIIYEAYANKVKYELDH